MKYILILLYCYSTHIQSVSENIAVENLFVETHLVISNSSIFNGGIKITTGPITINGPILFSTNTVFIGNNLTTTQCYLTTIPIGSEDETLPVKYLMVAETSNELYIGTNSSPLPPPDYYFIPDLLVDNISSNQNNTNLKFNGINNATIIGNETINILIQANNLEINNDNQISNNQLKVNNNTLTFSCPIIFTDTIDTTNTITVTNNVDCQNNSSMITIKTNSITYNNDLTVNGTLSIGNKNLENNIIFNNILNGNTSSINIGSAEYPILYAQNIPIINNMNSFLYLVMDPNTHLLYLINQPSNNTEAIDIITSESIETNFINTSNTASTTFTANQINCNGSITLAGPLSLSNVTFDTPIIYSNVIINTPSSLYFNCLKDIIINQSTNNQLAINTLYANNLYCCSNNIIWNNYPTSSNFYSNYLSINSDTGEVCFYGLAKNNKREISKHIKKIELILEKITHDKKTNEKKYKQIKDENLKLKKIIRLLKCYQTNII